MPKYIYNLIIFIFQNLSRNYSISDQAIIALNLKVIWDPTGANGFFGLFLKTFNF